MTTAETLHDAPEQSLNISEFTFLTYARGATAGLAGASTLAAFFFVADLVQGLVAFRTPAAMGSVILRGEMLASTAPVEPVLVAAYTFLHGSAFVALGILAAIVMQSWRPNVGRLGLTFGLSGLLFLAFQGFIALLGLLFEPALITELGIIEVSVANALSAGIMGNMLALSTDR